MNRIQADIAIGENIRALAVASLPLLSYPQVSLKQQNTQTHFFLRLSMPIMMVPLYVDHCRAFCLPWYHDEANVSDLANDLFPQCRRVLAGLFHVFDTLMT